MGERNVRYEAGTSDDDELLQKKVSNSDGAVEIPSLSSEETMEGNDNKSGEKEEQNRRVFEAGTVRLMGNFSQVRSREGSRESRLRFRSSPQLAQEPTLGWSNQVKGRFSINASSFTFDFIFD